METLIKEVEVSKEYSELLDGITSFIAAVKKSQDDGWQYTDDIPEIISAAMEHLTGALTGVGEISEEMHDLKSFVAATLLGVHGLADAVGLYK